LSPNTVDSAELVAALEAAFDDIDDMSIIVTHCPAVFLTLMANDDDDDDDDDDNDDDDDVDEDDVFPRHHAPHVPDLPQLLKHQPPVSWRVPPLQCPAQRRKRLAAASKVCLSLWLLR